MITLAFGQMAFFTASSLSQYGGDDGLTLPDHSTLFGTAVLANRIGLYYVALALPGRCAAGPGPGRRAPASAACCAAAGMRRSGCGRSATTRSRIRLLAYAASGAITGVAGALLAELTQFASPAYMAWPRSGDLLVAVILGGAGTLAARCSARSSTWRCPTGWRTGRITGASSSARCWCWP